MAANFWTSSHCKQLLDPEELDVVHSPDKEKGLTPEDIKFIKIQMTNRNDFTIEDERYFECSEEKLHLLLPLDIWKLAQNIKLRQRVVATAVTYFRRVYTRKSMREYDPRLVAPTCLYLASKAEESTVQARLIGFYLKKLCADEKYRFEVKDILEMEMKLLEALDYYLVIYHPYRPLIHLLQDAGMTDLTNTAWSIVNDTYKMDLILVHPPYMIALACIYIASVLKDQDTTVWFEELRVDMNVIKNISMEILDFYDAYKTVTEDRVNAALNKLSAKP